jgi:Phosphodiester glycosidase/Phosphoesterase family
MKSRRSSRRSLCTPVLILALALVAGAPLHLAAQPDCADNPWAPGWAPSWQPIFQGVDWAGACTTRAAMYDVAEWLLPAGAANGFNLDGGGSTTMAMKLPGKAGGVEILNNPGEVCAQRYVGALLGVRAKALFPSHVPKGCKTESCGAAHPHPVAAVAKASWPVGLSVYDHVVIVVEENKDYDEIIGQPAAPYINKLGQEGANFTRFYAEEHHSQGNYFWLLSGSDQNVGFDDAIPTSATNPNYPFPASNLAQQLIAKGLSFKGYSESLPEIGSTVDGCGNYARKHVPWISFQNIPNCASTATSSNLRFLDFLEAMYGLGRSGAQQPKALQYGIPDDFIIVDVFESPK